MARAQDVAGYFTPEEWAEALFDDISLDEVRRALFTISGSLSDAVIALRQERTRQALPQGERIRIYGPHP